MAVTGIHHIALKCGSKEKFDKTVAFYKDLLGLSVKRAWNGAVMLDTGAGLLEIFEEGDEVPAMGQYRHVAFAVTNPDPMIEAIRAAGYAITMECTDIVIPSNPPYPARIAFCIGELSEEIELFCEKS